MDMCNHEAAVREFLQQKKEENPEKYEEVCQRYPVQTSARLRVIRRRETRLDEIPLHTAHRHNLEPRYQMDEEG